MHTTSHQRTNFTKSIMGNGFVELSIRIILSCLLLACIFLPVSGRVLADASPTFSIVSTNPGVSVTIQTANFPASKDFTVRMGEYGTLAVDGVVVGTTNSGAGGAFQATYNIPDSLKDRKYIAMRFDSSTGSYSSYNWFLNKNDGVLPPGGTTPEPSSSGVLYSGIPTFQVQSVNSGVSIKIQTYNFPPNQDFTVRMGEIGTMAVGGIVVGTTNSGVGGSYEATYNIPNALKNDNLIAVRMDNPNGHYYSYNWFENIPLPASVLAGGTPGYSGKPSFTIQSVVQGDKVTIKTTNFPANQKFTVRMREFGTAAIGGTIVGTTDSGAGGAFEATYSIPAWLKGYPRIAIRMDNPTGFYYTFNWFWNYGTAVAAAPVTPGGSGPETPTAVPTVTYTATPQFTILSVVKDGKVTVETSPFPPDHTFTIRMGTPESGAVNGTVVGTAETKTGGSFKATYDIPAELKGLGRIAIRMESTDGYFAYNWFWNTTVN